MAEKFNTYKRHNWTDDKDWQQYLNNIYPMPSSAKVEKMRRKWYKKNKDPDFDVDYDPDAAQANPQQNQGQQGANTGNAGMSDQQRFYQRYQQQYQQQNPGAAYSANCSHFVDRWAAFKQPHILGMLAYLITYPLGLYNTPICFAAQVFGVLRKTGKPQMSAEYAQQIVFLEDFQNIMFLMSIMMAPKNLLICSPLIISTLLMLAIECKKMLDVNPSTPGLSNATVKQYVLKGANNQTQEYGRIIRCDMEAYIGFFMVGLCFLGQSNFMGVICYWQMMRVRYMMNQGLQMAFQRMDQNLQGYLNHQYCPAMARTAYQYIKQGLSNMTDTQAQAERVQQSGGGIMGAVKNSCNIF